MGLNAGTVSRKGAEAQREDRHMTENYPMVKSSLIAVLLIIATVSSTLGQQAPAPPSDPVVKGALVRVADQIKLPAMEAGVLVKLIAKEGAQVRAGEVIGNIDDREPQMKKKAAYHEYVAAYKRATDDVEIQFAQAQADVAKAELKRLTETNRIATKAIPETEVEKARLDVTHFALAIKKSLHDQELAKYEAATKQAELDAANLSIERRVVKAPFDGVVEEIKRHESEWVQPGDTILTLLKLDTMHVEGAVDQSQYDPHEVQGCEVSVDVELARGRKATVRGRIIKVSAIVDGRGTYYVRAEIANQQEHGSWLLRDQMPATMTIRLGTGGTAGSATANRTE